jgi:hypothetical protein
VLVATALLGAGFTLASLQLTGVYARMMGARLEDLGTKMTWFFAVVCLARCLGTRWVGWGMGLGDRSEVVIRDLLWYVCIHSELS